MIDSESVASSLARKNQNLSGASGSAESVLLEVYRIADREEGAFGSFLNHVTLGLLPFSKERTSEFCVAIYPFEKKGMKPVWFKAEMTQEERFTPLFFWPFFGRGEGDVGRDDAGGVGGHVGPVGGLGLHEVDGLRPGDRVELDDGAPHTAA
jgi:hypothetical protein